MSVVAVATTRVMPSARASFVVKLARASRKAMRADAAGRGVVQACDRQMMCRQRRVQPDAAMRGDDLDAAVRGVGEARVLRLAQRRLVDPGEEAAHQRGVERHADRVLVRLAREQRRELARLQQAARAALAGHRDRRREHAGDTGAGALRGLGGDRGLLGAARDAHLLLAGDRCEGDRAERGRRDERAAGRAGLDLRACRCASGSGWRRPARSRPPSAPREPRTRRAARARARPCCGTGTGTAPRAACRASSPCDRRRRVDLIPRSDGHDDRAAPVDADADRLLEPPASSRASTSVARPFDSPPRSTPEDETPLATWPERRSAFAPTATPATTMIARGSAARGVRIRGGAGRRRAWGGDRPGCVGARVSGYVREWPRRVLCLRRVTRRGAGDRERRSVSGRPRRRRANFALPTAASCPHDPQNVSTDTMAGRGARGNPPRPPPCLDLAARVHRDRLPADAARQPRCRGTRSTAPPPRARAPCRAGATHRARARASAGSMPRSSASCAAERSAMSVCTQPGQTALQVMPKGPTSCAAARMRPITACFEVV